MRAKSKPAAKSTTEFIADDGTINFGKYKGEDIHEVASTDPGYLLWVLDNLDIVDYEEVRVALRVN